MKSPSVDAAMVTADERMQGQQAVKANKQTHRRELVGLVCERTGPRYHTVLGWTKWPASDVPVVHDGVPDVHTGQTWDVVDFGLSGLQLINVLLSLMVQAKDLQQ